MKLIVRISAIAVAAGLAACAPVPDLGPVPPPRAAESVGSAGTFAQVDAVAWPADGWWTAFGDPQLSALIEAGLRHSPDAAMAAARLRRAQGMAEEAGAARYPSVDLQGSAALDKQTYNNGFPKEFVPKGWKDRGSLAGVLDFDLDLWGRNRAAFAAATSEARAARLDAMQARLAIAAGITLAYADLQRLFDERDARAELLAGHETSVRLVGDRFRAGLETRGNERAAAAAAETARAELAGVDQAIAARRNQIAALLGAGPDSGLAIARPRLAAPGGLGIPEDATTALVIRRPDVAAARDRAEAAARRIDVARAGFFPSLRLNALVGVQALGLGSLVEGDSLYGNVGPVISLPIFRGGALSGRFRQARGGYDEAVAAYEKAVLTAYQETADAVSDRRLLAERVAAANRALQASRDALSLARQRYDAGLSNYLDVLVVQERFEQARLQSAALTAAARAADVALIRALGGGMTAAPAPAKDDAK